MGQILVRDLDDVCVDRLKARAAHSGRSLQAEVKMILEQASLVDVTTVRRMAEEMRARIGRRSDVDSAEIVRELRDG